MVFQKKSKIKKQKLEPRSSLETVIVSLQQSMEKEFAVLNRRIDDLHLQINFVRNDMRDFHVTLKQHDDRLTKIERGGQP